EPGAMSGTSITHTATSDIPPDAFTATHAWLNRQSRRTWPAGAFDHAGRWRPDDESQPCCRAIRGLSRASPYSLLTHCRSAQHGAALHGVDVRDLYRAIRASALHHILHASSEDVPLHAGASGRVAPDRSAEHYRRFNDLRMERGAGPSEG